jgi:hypothetical protein
LPYTASLADHLRSLVSVMDSRREALRLVQADSWTDFSAGLFGERETIASFQIPVEVVKWCSEVLEIALDCYTPYSDETDEAQASVADSRTNEPDRAFSYIARAGTQPLSFLSSRETNFAASDELLARTIAAPATVVSSDLPETALASEHLERAISLLRLRHASAGFEQNLQVVCMFTTERGTGSIVTLELPILQQMAEVGASFRIDVHQAPSVLRRLRQAS